MKKPSAWGAVDAIREQARLVVDDVPACAFSINDYAEKYRIPRSTAQQQLERLVVDGKLKTGMVRGARGKQRMYWPA